MTIYVGNLSHRATEQELNDLFSEYGEVTSVKIMKDKMTGNSRGFAFVEMEDEPANQAITALHETDFLQRRLIVNEARPKTENGGGDRGGSRGGSFNRGSGDGGYRRNSY